MTWIPDRWRRRRRRVPRDVSLSEALLEHFPGAALLADADGVVLRLSPGAEAHLGHAASDLVGKRLTGLDEDPLRGELARGMTACLAQGRPWRGPVRCRRADGDLRYQDVVIRPLAGGEGPPRLLVVLHDVDDLVAPARDDRERLAELEASIARLPGVVFRLRQTPRGELGFDYLSDGIRELCGLTPEALRASPEALFARMPDEDRRALSATLARSAVGLMPWEQAVRLTLPQGERWLEMRARVRRGKQGVTLWDGWLQDITQRKEEEARTRALVTTDMLTGLLNRRGFFANGRAVMAYAARHHHRVAVAMLDLDHFKALNDTYGHAAGDIALQCFARTCRDCLRPYDLIARLGGEEFAIMLADGDPEEAWRVFERLRRRVAEAELALGGETLHITVSLGLAFLEPDGDLNEVLGRADRALYRAKREGRNRVVGPSPVV
ncbi:diguanylate cyclase [Halomonas organivorans]